MSTRLRDKRRALELLKVPSVLDIEIADSNPLGALLTAAPRVKVNLLDVFYRNDPKKLVLFKLQVAIYLRLYPKAFTTREDKVLFVTSYLRGDA